MSTIPSRMNLVNKAPQLKFNIFTQDSVALIHKDMEGGKQGFP